MNRIGPMGSAAVALVALLSVASPALPEDASTAAARATVDFTRDIAPLLQAKCVRCHKGDKQDGGLDMSSVEAMLRGGHSGPALVPGNVEKSLMLELIEFDEMPPRKEKSRVTKQELEKLTRWIAIGAPGSNQQSLTGHAVENQGAADRGNLPGDVAQLAAANNRFALQLYQRLAAADAENLFFSPSSISTAFAMAYGGARGETARQMAEVLHFPFPQDQLHAGFQRLGATIAGGQRKDYQLRIANRLWGREGFGFLPEFLRLTGEHYDAELAEVDFGRQPEAARRQINQWVAEQTQQKITDLIPPGVLDETSRLVLTNAIYFKGQWTSPFDPQRTKDAPFHLAGGELVEVPMMRQQDDFPYFASEGLQVLRLP